MADDVEPEGDQNGQSGSDGVAEGTALVTGRILDEDLQEVVGARVVLVQNDNVSAETETDAQGDYRVAGLEPGQYRMQVTAPCCREYVQGVNLVEGEETVLNIQLTLFTEGDLQIPYVEREEWSGQIGCSVRAAGVGYNLPCQDPNDDRVHEFQIEEGLKTLVVAMDWDPLTHNVNEELVLRHYRGSGWDGDTFFRINSGPPIETRVDEESAADGEHLYYSSIEDSWDVRFQVWTGGTNSLSYQQPFTVWYELHYWEPAPEDASALPDQ